MSDANFDGLTVDVTETLKPGIFDAAIAKRTLPDGWLVDPVNWGYSSLRNLVAACDISFAPGDGIDDGWATSGSVIEGAVTIFGTLISFHGRRWFVRLDLTAPPVPSRLRLAELAGSGRHRLSRYASADQVEYEEWEQQVSFVLRDE